MSVQRIRDNITEKEFKYLIRHLQENINIRANRKDRLIKTFHLLYVTGLRVNETVQLTNNMMIELLSTNKVKVVAHKQKREKLIYLTEFGKKQLSKVFILEANNDYIFTSERGKNERLAVNSVIRDVNEYLRRVFPDKKLSSHSFRASLITDLANKNINVKTIAELVSHADTSTTYRYIRPSEQDIMKSLESVR